MPSFRSYIKDEPGGGGGGGTLSHLKVCSFALKLEVRCFYAPWTDTLKIPTFFHHLFFKFSRK
jgi:hypothetical protein